MPELENKAVKAESGAGQPASTTGRDTISSLHKMSTTAGLGSQDYAAVNGACVASLFLGIATALGYFNNVFLVIPVAGVLLGVIGLRQVNRSNGTQTGKGMAIVGIGLSLVLGGVLVSRQVMLELAERPDRQQVVSLIEQFGQRLANDELDAAYELFSPRFQERVGLDEFKAMLGGMREHQVLGPVEGYEWSRGPISFHRDPDAGVQFARAMSMVRFRDLDEPLFRYEFVFSRSGEQWRIDNIPQFFPSRPD